jgi:hypothetical protein
MSNDGDERGVGGGMEGDKMGSVPEDEDAESGDWWRGDKNGGEVLIVGAEDGGCGAGGGGGEESRSLSVGVPLTLIVSRFFRRSKRGVPLSSSDVCLWAEFTLPNDEMLCVAEFELSAAEERMDSGDVSGDANVVCNSGERAKLRGGGLSRVCTAVVVVVVVAVALESRGGGLEGAVGVKVDSWGESGGPDFWESLEATLSMLGRDSNGKWPARGDCEREEYTEYCELVDTDLTVLTLGSFGKGGTPPEPDAAAAAATELDPCDVLDEVENREYR